jgi:hypothetical protein
MYVRLDDKGKYVHFANIISLYREELLSRSGLPGTPSRNGQS